MPVIHSAEFNASRKKPIPKKGHYTNRLRGTGRLQQATDISHKEKFDSRYHTYHAITFRRNADSFRDSRSTEYKKNWYSLDD